MSDNALIVVFIGLDENKVIKERSLIEELEKKFAGQSILIIAERRIQRREARNTRQLKQLRPRRCVPLRAWST